MSIKNEFGNHTTGESYLAQIRSRLDYTQAYTAKLLGVPLRTYRNWETLNQHPRIPARHIRFFNSLLAEAGLSLEDIPPDPKDDIFEYSLTHRQK